MKERRESKRAAWVRAAFGIERGRADGPPPWCDEAAAALDEALRPGGVALVTGPSGSGKSTILRLLERRLRRRGRRVVKAAAARKQERAVIDLFRGSAQRAALVLAQAGLAEARLMLRTPGELSEGQRARLWAALAMARARPGDTVILDEFGSTLDRIAAMSLARTLRRWAGAAQVRIVCATAHDDVLEWLAPQVLIEQSLGKPARVHRKDAA
jgi:ABC-type ATPase with predicted acetyltransferase domain